jgi:hypothetical protein
MIRTIAILIALLAIVNEPPISDVNIDVRTEKDVYYFGETIFMHIVIDNQCDFAVTVETGSTDYGLLGRLVIKNSEGKKVLPYLNVDATGSKEVKRKQRIELLVPLDVYGKKHPCAEGGVLEEGRYSWTLELAIVTGTSEEPNTRIYAGTFEVVSWPQQLHVVFTKFKDVVVSTRGLATPNSLIALLDILNSVDESRLRVLLLKKIIYYAKELDSVTQYLNGINELKKLSKISVAAHEALKDEKKVTKTSKFRFEYELNN